MGVGIIKLVLESESDAIASAINLIEQAEQTLPPESIQRDIIDIIETIVVYKLPQISREEIAQMLGLTDLKQTRFYQEAFADGRQEGLQQGLQEGLQRERINIVLRLANLGNSAEAIAQILGLPLEEIQQILSSSN
ncbi:conserved hypothetical protein [Limnospira maxima CS-328]|uniref:Rpn family recombination-promoting nuclease/putative transposase n=1 Tax=Limnospira maxima CS-328 TaxID=513049 RepID=B5W0B4_LIMMA|nr:conserved hypothetical protein [Limnospira maxima CS-328]